MGIFGADKYDSSKLKSHLKMTQSRIELLKNKKRNGVKLQRRQIAELLRQGKDESARIKVENVIREDFMIEAFEILELFCDLVQTRVLLISESRTCPTDLKEAISSILYAAPRCDIPELMVIRDQLSKKFGKEFVLAAMENRDFAVNQRVLIKLSVKVPEPYLCVHYLKDIAEEHGIELDAGGIGNDAPPPSSSNNGGHMDGGGMGGGNMGGMGGGMGGYIPQSTYPVQPSLQMDHQAMSSQQFHQPSSSMPSSLHHHETPPVNNGGGIMYPTTDHHFGMYSNNSQQLQAPQAPPPQQQPPLNHLTHSGYNVDFTPGHMIVPSDDLPKLGGYQSPVNNIGGGGNYQSSSAVPSEEPPAYDFDDLQKRFEALKRREQ